jgi:NitT/TauT family transport system substrate-binding protein
MRVLFPVIVWLATCVSLGAEPILLVDGGTSHRIVLLVDEIKSIRNLPVAVAERLGYLQRDGFTVTVMNIRDDIPTADMLMDGRVDAVMAYYHHNIVNQAEGRKFEAIVTLGVTPGVKVLVANQSKEKYKTVADLKGARIIAGGTGSSKTTVANALMLAGGHKISDYTRIPNESKDKIVAALKNGEADLVVAPTPDGNYYEAQGVATVFADLTTVEGTKKYFGTLFPSATVYMTAERAGANPEIAQHLATAFACTLKWINTHSPEEILAVIPGEISGKDRDSYFRTLKEELPMFATDGRMPEEGAEKEGKVLSEFNPKYKSVRIEDTYTNKFAEQGLERCKAGLQQVRN